MLTRSGWSSDDSIGTDNRKVLAATLNAHLDHNRDGTYNRTLGIALAARPSSNLNVSIGPTITRSHIQSQYVTTVLDPRATVHVASARSCVE